MTSANAQVKDVQLSNSGTLQGVILPVSSTSVAGSVVQVRYQGKTIATAKTAADGRFAIGHVRPGVHEIVTAGHQTPVRIWASGTAPAGCQSQLTLTSQPPMYAQEAMGMCGEGCGPTNGCVPCQTCETNSAFGVVDAISLATVGSSIAALVIAIDANRSSDAASNAAAAAGGGVVANADAINNLNNNGGFVASP